MHFPLILFDGCDISLYKSLDTLVKDVEWPEVSSNQYTVYDYWGYRIALSLEGGRQIKAELDEATPSDRETLCNRLRECLLRSPKIKEVPTDNEVVLQLAQAYFGVYE